MRSAVLLLAALCAARLRPGSAEGEPLPSSLVLLLRSSSISSVDDLKMLLQQEGGATEDDDEDEDEAAGGPLLVNQTHSRSTRSVAAVQPAQQAVCKLRTEVMEVTRSMLDRRNANFLLWPPCVEVQRCSGCCNTRARQCVAAAAATRRLTVIKIQYSNKRPHYAHATITVEDHVSCRCQLSSSSSSSSSIIIQRNPVPPPPSSPRAPPSAHASKADLHRHDDLKHNQQHGGGGRPVRWAPPSPRPAEARAAPGVAVGHGSGSDGSREESGVHPAAAAGGEEEVQPLHGGGGEELRTQRRLNTPQSDAASPPGGPGPAPPATANQKDSEVATQAPTLTSNQTTGGGEREESGSAHSGAGAEPANRGAERDSEVGGGFGHLTEEEEEERRRRRRRKAVEVLQEPDPQTHLHPRLHQRRPKPTTLRTGLLLLSAPPASPSTRRPPFRPASPRRRREHRRRINKAALRALIM